MSIVVYGDSGLELLVGGEFEFDDDPPPRTASTDSSTRLISNCSFTLTKQKINWLHQIKCLNMSFSVTHQNNPKYINFDQIAAVI